MNDPWPVSLSVRVYHRLLFAYPQNFRRAYSEAMLQTFRDLCLHSGKAGLAGVWGQVLIDYTISLVSEYMEKGVEMTKSKWIQLSGWGLAASGFLMMAGFAAGTRPTYNPSNAAAWPVDPILNAVDLLFVTIALLLMSAGLAGLLARFGENAGELGRGGLALGSVAGLISAVASIGLAIQDRSPWWDLFITGFLGVNLGLFLFGIACLRHHLFTRWNGLPLAIGGIFLSFTLASMGLIQLQWPSLVVTLIFLAFASGLGLVGYRLQSEAVEHPSTTPA